MSHTHTTLMHIAMLEQQRDELIAALKNLVPWLASQTDMLAEDWNAA